MSCNTKFSIILRWRWEMVNVDFLIVHFHNKPNAMAQHAYPQDVRSWHCNVKINSTKHQTLTAKMHYGQPWLRSIEVSYAREFMARLTIYIYTCMYIWARSVMLVSVCPVTCAFSTVFSCVFQPGFRGTEGFRERQAGVPPVASKNTIKIRQKLTIQ